MNEIIRVLLVDDHEVVRNGMQAYLDSQPEFEVVGEAASGVEAVGLVKRWVPDVVLMDLVMPRMDGVEATRRIRDVSPRTQVVVLTSYHNDEYVFPVLQAGALSYVLKSSRMEEVAEAIRLASRGEALLHPQIASRVIRELTGRRREQINPFVELTDREMDVLRLIAEGLSNREIAEKLIISENTVKGYVSNILGKLHLNDRTQAAVYAWKEGIKRRDSS
jgi:NarL family two-component system response regulator LiaR